MHTYKNTYIHAYIHTYTYTDACMPRFKITRTSEGIRFIPGGPPMLGGQDGEGSGDSPPAWFAKGCIC